jgi:Fic family protein
MRRINGTYIHLQEEWPAFSWDHEVLLPLLTRVRHKQGRVKGNMEVLGSQAQSEATWLNVSSDVLKSSEIEGELLNADQVRSSVARHLGLKMPGLVKSDRNIDGVVEMMLDATQNFDKKITKERLCSWHSLLFPDGSNSVHKITVGKYRKGVRGPMQVVSGAAGRERVHFEAPDAKRLEQEMKFFMAWMNNWAAFDAVIASAVAHLWFVTIHPFDDGNGRIARALADMLLARSDQDTHRFYSMSAQIRSERKAYYEILEKTQKGNLDITEWLVWYLNCLDRALDATDARLKTVLKKTAFWDKHSRTEVNERQRKVVNKLFDGFEGKLTSTKWAKMTKCSSDTALRDIQDLIKKKILKSDGSGGRSAGYVLL